MQILFPALNTAASFFFFKKACILAGKTSHRAFKDDILRTCAQQKTRRPLIRAKGKKDRMWCVQSFYTEPEEREGCACSCCCQTKNKGCHWLGWHNSYRGDWLRSASRHTDSMVKNSCITAEARLWQQRTKANAALKRIKTSQFQFFQRHLFY